MIAVATTLKEWFNQFKDETGYKCPHCSKRFTSLPGIKGHMTDKHGGFTVNEIAATLPTERKRESAANESPANSSAATEAGAAAVETASPSTAPVIPPPKRIGPKQRELNDKTNRALRLVGKRLMKGLSDEESAELERLRDEVLDAMMGIEIDFDEKLFTVKGRWIMWGVAFALLIGPWMPTMKETFTKLREMRTHATKKPDSGDRGTEGQRQDVAGVETL